MAVDLSAGLSSPAPSVDLTAGIMSDDSAPRAKQSVDLSAGLTSPPSARVDLSAGLDGGTQPQSQPSTLTWPDRVSIAPYRPSVWERIKNVFLQGIPQYSMRTLNDPHYGEEQLLTPEELMTPSQREAHPIATGISEFAGGMTTPQSVALISATGGLGELPGAAAMLPRLMSAGFGAQSIYAAYKTIPQIRDAWNRGDTAEVERLLTHATLDVAMGAAAGRHAATGKAGVSGRTTESEAPAPPVEVRPTPKTSPLGELLHDDSPEVRIADSTAAREHIVNQETVQNPWSNLKYDAQAQRQARSELGQSADPKEVLRRAQEIKTQLMSEAKPQAVAVESPTNGQGGHAGNNVASVEELHRPGTNYVIGKTGTLTYHGKSFAPEETPAGATHVTVLPDKTYRINTGNDLNATQLARLKDAINAQDLQPVSARVVDDSYTPVVSRDAIVDRAIQRVFDNSAELKQIGIDPSSVKTYGDIEGVLMRASDRIRSGLDPRAEAVISLEGQRDLADKLDMTTEDLLTRRGGQAYNAEELLVARGMLNASYKDVLASAKAATDNPTSASQSAFADALSRHKAIQETVAGVRTETGRALGSFRVTNADLPEKKITDIFSKLPEDKLAETAGLLSKLDTSDPNSVRILNQFVEEATPRTLMEKAHEIYRNSLLSSPHTLIVKTASELSMAAMETMKKAVAGGIGALKDSPDRFASEAFYYARGMAQALSEHAKPILSGEFQLEGSPGFEQASTVAVKGPLGQVIRIPSEAMSRMTNLLYAGNYFGEIQSLAARRALSEGLDGDAFHARQEFLAHHPTDEMIEAAHKLATTNTFQNRLSGFAGRIQQAISARPNVSWLPESLKSVSPLKFLFPFYRTPVNLVKATLTHATPYELLNGLVKGDPDATARGILGSSISAALAYLALSGHITGGGPTDLRKEETLRATGWSPYSLKVGDKYYSYRRFEPVGLAAGLIADAVHSYMSGDPEIVAQSKADAAIKHIMRNLDDLPFLGTLSNLIQAVHDPVGGRAQTFINREAGSLVPAIVANVAQGVDRTVRRPGNPLQAIESRVPGLTGKVPPVLDISGKPVRRSVSEFGGANPFGMSEAKHDPVLDELARLGVRTSPSPTTAKFRGRKVELLPDERTQVSEAEGEELYRRMSSVVSTPAWQRLDDASKRQRVTQIRREIEQSRPQRISRLLNSTQAQLSSGSL